MGQLKTLNKWANAHTYYPLDLLRIALGVFLFMKGRQFMSGSLSLTELIEPIDNALGGMFLIHLIIPAHLIGGILIVFGLLTRWSVLVQIPILLGAILINFLGVMNNTNLIVSAVVLVVCIFFLFYGSGRHSIDKYLKMGQ